MILFQGHSESVGISNISFSKDDQGKFNWHEESSFYSNFMKIIKMFINYPIHNLNWNSTVNENTLSQSLSKNVSGNSSQQHFCGVPDFPDFSSHNNSLHHRVKRYRLEGTKWPKLEVTWAVVIKSRSRVISEEEIVGDLQTAFNLWSDVSKIRFLRVDPSTPKIDIAIGFHTGSHGDPYPFDGPGQTLAHAFYPGSGGDVHFDDTEDFRQHHRSIREKVGTSFLVTAAHELGHSLGLHHSNVFTALMAPFYRSYPETFKLPDDDIRAIRALYGSPGDEFSPIPYVPSKTSTTTPRIPITTKRTTSTSRHPYTRPETTTVLYPIITTTTTTTAFSSPLPETSMHPFIPTSATTETNPSTFSKTTTPISSRLPTTTPYNPPPIITQTPTTTSRTSIETTRMPQMPTYKPSCEPKSTNLDLPDTCSTSFDSVTSLRGEVFFFKDRYMWRAPMMRDDYPKRFDRLFPQLSVVKSIDAAYETPDKKSLVIFSDDNFFKINIDRPDRPLEKGKLIDMGINKNRIDAAFVWGFNGHIYVLSGSQYWRLDHNGRAEEDYPRHMGVWQGVPNNVSAAATIGTKTYFFSGQVYWPFDNKTMSVIDPPRHIGSYWLECPYREIEKRRLCSSAIRAEINSYLNICYVIVGCLIMRHVF